MFKPGTKEGKPVAVQGTVEVNYPGAGIDRLGEAMAVWALDQRRKTGGRSRDIGVQFTDINEQTGTNAECHR